MDKLEAITRLKENVSLLYNMIYNWNYPLIPSSRLVIQKEIDDINAIIQEIRESK